MNGDSWAGQDGLERGPARSWGFFDIRTVISATSDLFDFILSEDGYRVRVWLVKDIVEAFNILFDHAVQGNNEDHYSSVGAKRDQDARSQEVRLNSSLSYVLFVDLSETFEYILYVKDVCSFLSGYTIRTRMFLSYTVISKLVTEA